MFDDYFDDMPMLITSRDYRHRFNTNIAGSTRQCPPHYATSRLRFCLLITTPSMPILATRHRWRTAYAAHASLYRSSRYHASLPIAAIWPGHGAFNIYCRDDATRQVCCLMLQRCHAASFFYGWPLTRRFLRGATASRFGDASAGSLTMAASIAAITSTRRRTRRI